MESNLKIYFSDLRNGRGGRIRIGYKGRRYSELESLGTDKEDVMYDTNQSARRPLT